MAYSTFRLLAPLVVVVVMAVLAEATPPGIAKNPSHATCKIKKYKHCYNLVHVCPKFCPDQCYVECASCKPICGSDANPPPEDDPTPSTPSPPTETYYSPPPPAVITPSPPSSTPTLPYSPPLPSPTPVTPSPSPPTLSSPPPPFTGIPSTPPATSSPPPVTSTPPPVNPNPPSPPPVNPNPPSTPPVYPNPPSNPNPPSTPPSNTNPPPSTPPASPNTPSTPPADSYPPVNHNPPSNPNPPSTPPVDQNPPSNPNPPSTPPANPNPPSNPPSTPPTSPNPPIPSTPNSPSPSWPPPTRSETPNSPTTNTPPPASPRPSQPASPPRPPPTGVAGQPPAPTPPSSSTSGAKRVRCKNVNYPECYNMIHTCPSGCPSGCEVDCVTCKPVCHCDRPGAVCQDPRFIGADGITFYFHGKKDKDFCLVSDPNFHINAHFIGKRNPSLKRDFTWVQSIGILFRTHRLFIAAQKTTVWDDSADRLTIALDDRPVALPKSEGCRWQHPAGNPTIVIVRLATANHVMVEAKGLFRITAKVVPITEEDSRIHNYGIDEGDSFAHLDLGFKFFGLSSEVNGVLGQTYGDGYVSSVNVKAAMAVMGREEEFETSSLFATDCAVARFGSGDDQEVV